MGEKMIEEIEKNQEESYVSRPELAVGLKVPSSIKTPIAFIDSLNKYKDIFNDIYTQMTVCNKLYRFNAIVGNAVDVLIDFAVTDVKPQDTGNKKLDEILVRWFEIVNETNTNTLPGIYPLAQELCLEWFTSGNAFPYVKWDDIEINGSYFKFPANVHLINPQSISIPDGPIAFGQEVIYLKYDDKLLDKLRSDGRSDPEAALIKQAVPRSVLRALNQRESFGEGVRLNPKYITHLKRRAKSYQAWGTPYLLRSFESVSLIERMKKLDESVTEGLVNLTTIYKIGNDLYPASQARLSAFKSLISDPKATQTLVWAHDVEILQVGPEGKVLQYKDKYREAKQDVLIALGIPPVLMSLESKGDEWVAILSLVERLSHWRKMMSLWMEKICNEIALYNGFEGIKVKVKWDRMNLTDEKAIKNLVLSFYDRGLISVETSLDDSGYIYDTEKGRKKDEKKDQDLWAAPSLPYSGNQNTSQGKPSDSDVKVSKTVKKKDSTKPETVVNDKPIKEKEKPTR